MIKATAAFLLSSSFLLAHPNHGQAHFHHVQAEGEAGEAELPATIGHNGHVYSIDRDWAKVTPEEAPVINSHAIAEGKDGLLYLVTDHPENAILVFKKDGTFVRAFGKGLVGGHGIELFEHDGEELIIHVDCGWHFAAEGWNAKPNGGSVSIVKKDGTVVRKLPSPQELGQGVEGKKFMPCDAAIAPNGNILIIDGYATDFVFEYTPSGEFVKRWGGPAAGQPGHLANAHGISTDLTDPEKPLIWISSRDENKLKAFTPEGEWVETIELPGAYAGQLFIRDGKMYSAVCWSKKNGEGARLPESGFIVVLDAKTRKVISAPGGTEPVYKEGVLQPLEQKHPVFIQGHDLYVDADGAIYVGEWKANRRYPTKLTPAS